MSDAKVLSKLNEILRELKEIKKDMKIILERAETTGRKKYMEDYMKRILLKVEEEEKEKRRPKVGFRRIT